MRFSLPVLSSDQVLIAQNPEIGVESNVWVAPSPVEVVKLGTIRTDAAGAITWTPKPGVSYGAGLDIHVSLATAIFGTLAPVITLNATIVTAGAGTLATTLAIPSYVIDQRQLYPIGYAADMIPQGAGNSARLITAIAGVASLANVPNNAELTVWGSPVEASFVEVGWKKSVEGGYNTPSSVSIPNRYNPSGAIKKGVAEVSDLAMEFNHLNSADGMTRYSGMRCSVLVKVKKDDAVFTENVLYIGHRPNAMPKRGGGNDEVVESSTGPVENCIRFFAL